MLSDIILCLLDGSVDRRKICKRNLELRRLPTKLDWESLECQPLLDPFLERLQFGVIRAFGASGRNSSVEHEGKNEASLAPRRALLSGRQRARELDTVTRGTQRSGINVCRVVAVVQHRLNASRDYNVAVVSARQRGRALEADRTVDELLQVNGEGSIYTKRLEGTSCRDNAD